MKLSEFDMNDIFSIQKTGSDPIYKRMHDLPEDIFNFLNEDRRINSVRKYDNGEIVAKHNYKRNAELHKQGLSVVLYVSSIAGM